jgi:hypothetical protein
MRKVIPVFTVHPSRQGFNVDASLPDDVIDTNPLLPRIPPFLAHGFRLHGGGCHYQNQVFAAVQRLLDLLPPVTGTLFPRSVEPDRDAMGLNIYRKLARPFLAIFSRVGNKHTITSSSSRRQEHRADLSPD